ncbi:MAG TPA: sulfatase-like hydrolase/transferase [Thermoguttaceae bacterium]|nr:sulfatase-like hydrolase/transferase [Thermoguttaceae bacterium]
MSKPTPRRGAFFLAIVLQIFCSASLRAADRPNFLWILSEDNSKHYMKLFDENGAPAPNIEKLASQGLVFDHAFCNAPVCSVARTTLITGLYAPRVGTQFHRRSKTATLPDGWRMFPAYLREAGYYATNNSKKDYNAVELAGVWDASSGSATWRDRPSKDTPFFHMQSFGASHESSLHFSEKQIDFSALGTDPKSVAVAPYHPDTDLFRYTYARYHDRIGAVDQFVGKMVDQLAEDGLLEDTFIFYFGDNGGVLPGSKGYIYESGLHVPLVVRVPENWKHLVDAGRGTRVQGFVSFADFGPTLLQLAGVPLPKHFDGKPFLGKDVTLAEVDARDEAFGYADRFDEKYDLCRSLRKGRYKYIRHYQAFYPDALQNNYRYKMLAYQQWRTLYREGKLDAAQRRFFEPKPVEVLYDLQTDPYEVNNLAGDPAHAEVLAQMRGLMQQRVKGMPDLSFYPESYLVEHAMDAPVAFGQQHAEQIARLVDVADLSLLPAAEAVPKLEKALASSNPWERYWALIACSCLGDDAKELAEAAQARLDDPELLVRVRAAEFLGIIGAADPRPTLRDVLEKTGSNVEALLTLNTVVFFHDRTPGGYAFDVKSLNIKASSGEVGRRIDYLSRK